MTPGPGYVPVPVEAAREIAEKYAKSIVIINCWDSTHGMIHTTTYGIDAQHKEWAALGGEVAARALGGLVEAATNYEDYRLTQARKLLDALRVTVQWLEAAGGYSEALENCMIYEKIRTAEHFLEVPS